jgi:hypothetical protein
MLMEEVDEIKETTVVVPCQTAICSIHALHAILFLVATRFIVI